MKPKALKNTAKTSIILTPGAGCKQKGPALNSTFSRHAFCLEVNVEVMSAEGFLFWSCKALNHWSRWVELTRSISGSLHRTDNKMPESGLWFTCFINKPGNPNLLLTMVLEGLTFYTPKLILVMNLFLCVPNSSSKKLNSTHIMYILRNKFNFGFLIAKATQLNTNWCYCNLPQLFLHDFGGLALYTKTIICAMR